MPRFRGEKRTISNSRGRGPPALSEKKGSGFANAAARNIGQSAADLAEADGQKVQFAPLARLSCNTSWIDLFVDAFARHPWLTRASMSLKENIHSRGIFHSSEPVAIKLGVMFSCELALL